MIAHTFVAGAAKPPVVFFHGDFHNSSVFTKLSSFFQQRGHPLLLFDLPGRGKSLYMPEQSDVREIVHTFLIERKLVDPIFVAHSAGAALALDYIERGGSVSALCLINPVLAKLSQLNPNVDMENLYEQYRDNSERLFKQQEYVDYTIFNIEPEILAAGMRTTHPQSFQALAQFYRSMPDFTRVYQLKTPIVYVASCGMEAELLMPISYHQNHTSRLKNAHVHILHAAHNPHITHVPEVKAIVEKEYVFLLSGERGTQQKESSSPAW